MTREVGSAAGFMLVSGGIMALPLLNSISELRNNLIQRCFVVHTCFVLTEAWKEK